MQRTNPPFRADHVGSLLRSPILLVARQQRERGEISAAALKLVEDHEIRALIRKQEAAGLQSITDGEYRRASWQTDFLTALDGVEAYEGERKFKFQGPQPRPILLRLKGKLGHVDGHPMIDHFRFVAQHTNATPKMTIPSPSTLHFRYGRAAVPRAIYRSMDEFYADMINAAISDVPADMRITMHLCRGNFRSTFVASGGYEPIAEMLFNTIRVHGYFMEYDSARAGGFEPLRFVPKGKQVVLGLVTSKAGTLESRDELKRRIDEAAKFVDLDQLCLSPQCGFASTEDGNVLAEEEQWAKLRAIVEVAQEVWG